jgi:hypothetical protein
MRIAFDLDGFEGRQLFVDTPGWFGGPRLTIDGKQAPRGPKRNYYLLQRNDGIEQTVQLRQVFIDPIPQVIVAGKVIQLAEPLSLLQWIWSGLPLILLFLGGAIGGGIGGATFWVNTRIFRSEMSPIEQFILAGLACAIALFVYLILSTLVLRLMA